MDLSVLQTTGDSNVEAFLWPLLDELDAQLAMIKEQGIMKCDEVQDQCLDTQKTEEPTLLMEEAKTELLTETSGFIKELEKDYLKTLTEVIALRNKLESEFKDEPEVAEEK